MKRIHSFVFMACIAMVSGCNWLNVGGNEAGIVETCSGVEDKVYGPGTHFMLAFCNDAFEYNVGTQLEVLKQCAPNDAACLEDRDEDCFKVKVKGGQEVCLDLRTEYQLDSAKLVELHKSVKDQYEQVILRPAVIRRTKNRATLMTADELYADTTQVTLEKAVEEELLGDDDVKRAGIHIHSFIIESVHLDPAYESEVKQKSVAQQAKLKEIELAGAATERAKRVAADAQSQIETARAAAEGEKVGKVKAAEAEAERTVLQATAEKDASVLRAEGLLAQGRAEAEVDRLKRDALYAGEGGGRRAQVEMAQARAKELKGLLEGVNVVSDRAVLQLVDGHGGGRQAPVTPTVAAAP